MSNLDRLKEEVNCVYNSENIHRHVKLIFVILSAVKLLKIKMKLTTFGRFFKKYFFIQAIFFR